MKGGGIKARPVIETTTGKRYPSVGGGCASTGCSSTRLMAVLSGSQVSTNELVF
ncbi:hypothetical protein [Larkinella humicola]|uniref:hypothetical protein n=1 Tax=Larkinella humicola TaxID=2607654 RepID=UPI00177D5387|nr:hypothetical protein [Larkinella humicola]